MVVAMINLRELLVGVSECWYIPGTKEKNDH